MGFCILETGIAVTLALMYGLAIGGHTTSAALVYASTLLSRLHSLLLNSVPCQAYSSESRRLQDSLRVTHSHLSIYYPRGTFVITTLILNFLLKVTFISAAQVCKTHRLFRNELIHRLVNFVTHGLYSDVYSCFLWMGMSCLAK